MMNGLELAHQVSALTRAISRADMHMVHLQKLGGESARMICKKAEGDERKGETW